MEEIKKGAKKIWRYTKAIGKGLVEGLSEGIEKVEQIHRETESWQQRDILKNTQVTDGEIILNSGMMKSIRWMNDDQLRAIFSGKKVRVDGNPATWNELKWMNSDQLKAIFGEETIRR